MSGRYLSKITALFASPPAKLLLKNISGSMPSLISWATAPTTIDCNIAPPIIVEVGPTAIFEPAILIAASPTTLELSKTKSAN